MKAERNKKLADDEGINEQQNEKAVANSKPKGSMIINLALDESPCSQRQEQIRKP